MNRATKGPRSWPEHAGGNLGPTHYTRSGWRRVNREKPCPICGRPDWCLMAADESAAICARVSEGAVKPVGESGAGWLHHLRETARHEHGPRVRRVQVGEALPDLAALAEQYRRALTPARLAELSRRLGVSSASLERLGAGFDGRAFTFPMRDPTGRVIGIRRRLPDGQKLSVAGGKEGIFVPDELPACGLLIIAEGPTDTAALLDLGFAAVGRPSCTGGTRHVVALARGRDAAIVADADEPGQRGAASLASVLCVYCPRVRVIFPPAGIKDARAWVNCGATAADVQAAIDATEPVHLAVRGVHRG